MNSNIIFILSIVSVLSVIVSILSIVILITLGINPLERKIDSPFTTKIIDIRGDTCVILINGQRQVIQDYGSFNCVYHNIGDNVTLQKEIIPGGAIVWESLYH